MYIVQVELIATYVPDVQAFVGGAEEYAQVLESINNAAGESGIKNSTAIMPPLSKTITFGYELPNADEFGTQLKDLVGHKILDYKLYTDIVKLYRRYYPMKDKRFVTPNTVGYAPIPFHLMQMLLTVMGCQLSVKLKVRGRVAA